MKVAKSIVKFIGSPKFIVCQSLFLVVYMLSQGPDPYPFIFLNLLLSFQAAYAGPLILMAQNQTTEQDSANISKILYRLGKLEARLISKIEEIEDDESK